MAASKKPRYEYNGKPVQSVTEVLGIMNKPALVPWAAKMTAEAFESILTINYYKPEECLFTIPDTALPEIIKAAKSAHRAKSKDAMDHGTAVHNAIDAWIQSGGIMKAEEVKDEHVRQGLQAFLDYGETVDLEIVENEKQVFGWTVDEDKERGLDPLYAGRFDLLARIDGVLTMCDFKVSTGIWDEYWMQLEAYARAYKQETLTPVRQLAVFRIDKETGKLEAEYKPSNHDRYMIFWHLAKAKLNIEIVKGEK